MKYRYSLEELQNERYYLLASKESDIIKDIIKASFEKKDMVFLNSIKYSNCIGYYNELIKMAAELIKELKANNNSIILSMLVRELVFNGYFSENNVFDAVSGVNYYDVYGFSGLDIVNGKGCCRHYVSFYNNLFNELGILNYYTPCCMTNDNDVCLNDAFLMGANHVINTVSYQDTLYGYDCYTNAILKFIDAFTMLEVCNHNIEDKTIRCFYKPSVEMMLYGITYDEMYERLKSFLESSRNNHIDYAKCLEFNRAVFDICHDNKKLLKDFKGETKTLIKKITKELYSASMK